MKHSFLLDENILYHSIKGTDAQGNLDLTAMQLVVLIAQNCHTIRFNRFLLGKYKLHLAALKNEPQKFMQPMFFETLFFGNSLKAIREDANPPHLPANAQIPNEDIDVVRAALISHPKFVTNDSDLRDAINACQHLHLTALTSAQAVPFASET